MVFAVWIIKVCFEASAVFCSAISVYLLWRWVSSGVTVDLVYVRVCILDFNIVFSLYFFSPLLCVRKVKLYNPETWGPHGTNYLQKSNKITLKLLLCVLTLSYISPNLQILNVHFCCSCSNFQYSLYCWRLFHWVDTRWLFKMGNERGTEFYHGKMDPGKFHADKHLCTCRLRIYSSVQTTILSLSTNSCTENPWHLCDAFL